MSLFSMPGPRRRRAADSRNQNGRKQSGLERLLTVISSRQQADGSRQSLTQMFSPGLLLPAAYCLLPASLQLNFLKVTRIISWKRRNRGLVAQREGQRTAACC